MNEKISIDQKIKLISKVKLFQGLDKDQLTSLSRKIKQTGIIKKNTIIFNEDDTDDLALYIIYKGQVQIQKGMRNIDGSLSCDDVKYIVIGYKDQGSYFGEMSLIDKKKRSATILTTKNTILLKLSSQDFENIGSKDNIILDLLKKLRKTNKRLVDLALMDSYQKVAMIIYEDQLDQLQTGIVNKKKIDLNNKKIASLLAINLRDVGDYITMLKENGFIKKIGYKGIEIIKDSLPPQHKEDLENDDV